MIPEVAVEAAAKAYQDPPIIGRMSWDELAPMVRSIRLQKMRRALEAATPYMCLTPPTYSLEEVAAEFGIDLDELRKEEGAK